MSRQKDTPPPNAAGHRTRLRSRVERVSLAGLEEQELLELLLTFCLPRVDTKRLSQELIGRFSGLAGVLAANPSQLLEVPGIGPRSALLLTLVRPLVARSMTAPRGERVSLCSPVEAAEFFQTLLGHLQIEQVHAAFLNARNTVLAAELLHEGTVDHSVVYPRKVLERALHHRASGFILAHNHPSGDTTPSAQDISLTKNLEIAARALGVRFLDHLVIGARESYSFQRHGLL